MTTEINPTNLENLRNVLTFGVEVECSGITFAQAVECVRAVLGVPASAVHYQGSAYAGWKVTDATGRNWKVMSDGSVARLRGGDNCEIVTPVLSGGAAGGEGTDIDTVQNIVRAVRRAGGMVDESMGLHVHVGVRSGFNAKNLSTLAALVYSMDPMIREACGVYAARETWTNRNELTADKVDAFKACRSLADIENKWYALNTNGYSSGNRSHYCNSRYAALNLHSTFFVDSAHGATVPRGSVEFRYFNSTLHAGAVRANVALCLAMVAYALLAKRAPKTARATLNLGDKRWTMYRFLFHKLGLSGDAYKNVREHLTQKFPKTRQMRGGANAAA